MTASMSGTPLTSLLQHTGATLAASRTFGPRLVRMIFADPTETWQTGNGNRSCCDHPSMALVGFDGAVREHQLSMFSLAHHLIDSPQEKADGL